MFWILFVVKIKQHVGAGPVWFQAIDAAALCSDNWWTNLLYLNNFFHVQADGVSTASFNSECCPVPSWCPPFALSSDSRYLVNVNISKITMFKIKYDYNLLINLWR